MLAGLLFATQEADDRPGILTATLPFAAATLIEYQARLLIAAGAAQLVVVVARLTPELIGALARIGRRGVPVDSARTAADVAAKLHPLSRVVMLADGLVTTAAAVERMATDGGDALLVMPGAAAAREFERVGGGAAWAGVARIDARRIAEAAAMPADYDLQSTLVHAAGQARARRVELPLEEVEQGHGLERRADALEQRGRAVLAGLLAQRPRWFDRFALRPLARLLVPEVARRQLPTLGVVAAAGVVALAALVASRLGWPIAGLGAGLVATLLFEVAQALATFRDEAGAERGCRVAAGALPLAALVALGGASGTSALLLALGVAAAGGVAERAMRAPARRWWGSPAAYLAVTAAASVVAGPTIALALAAGYATATLAGAVEVLRGQA